MCNLINTYTQHRKRKVDEKSCVTFLLCDPGWCVHKSDVQKKWDENIHKHMHIFSHNL